MPIRNEPKPGKGWPLYNFMLITSLITGLSLGFRFSDKLIQNEKKRKEAEKEKLNTELAMLKNQINPHFLFNTLNTIYSLALMKSDLTAEAVMKLSDMMRYVIQDVNHDQVPLETEIEYIRYYVELQKLRLSDNVDLQLEIRGDPQPFRIAPMILIPFVENAFKYGTTSRGSATILVKITIGDKFLDFRVSNQIFESRNNNETFGIGINNTRQRLQLTYPGKHDLELTNNGKVYIVNLRIDMS
jgi:sensor histidine kinase YesM